MKRFALVSVLASILAITSCSKIEDTDVCGPVTTTAPASEVEQLKSYITSNNIEARYDSLGFYYVIKRPGGTAHPTVCSNVQVNYTGRLTNGSKFDGATGTSFSLNRLITGWKAGIPLIGEGGSITLYLPPSLGYGSVAQGTIPANSILIFEIDLLQFD